MASTAAARTLTPNQQERRQRILSAARDLVAKHGYDGTIMRDVAMLAKVSPTTLYNLYNTKDELLLEALRESVAEGWNRTAEEFHELGFDRLLGQMHNSVEQTREEPAYARAITQALLRANEGDQIVDVLIGGTTRAIVVSLEAMLEKGELNPRTDIQHLSETMVAAFWSQYMMWSKGQYDPDRLELELKRNYLSLLLPVCLRPLQQKISSELDNFLL